MVVAYNQRLSDADLEVSEVGAPPGWKRHWSTSTRLAFFENTTTFKTQ